MKKSRIKQIARAMEMAAGYLTGEKALNAKILCGRLLGLSDAQIQLILGIR